MALDNIDELDIKDVSPFPTALRYGVIGGLIGIALGLVLYLTDMDMTMTIIVSLLSIVVYIAVVIMAIRAHRDKELGGYISFGRCLGVGMITVIVMSIIGVLWTVILNTFIDPDLAEKSVEKAVEMMENFGMSDDEIEEARERAMESSGLGQQVKNSLIFTPIVGLIISLIAGAVMKKDRPIDMV